MFRPTMGIQLYTLRNHIKTPEDFDTTLGRLQAIGVTDVQISGIGDFPAVQQREILDKHSIKVCVTHKGFDRMLTDSDTMIEEHKAIGCDAMGTGMAPRIYRDSVEAVRRFVADSDKVGAGLQKHGMTFNYHNHDFEFKTIENSDLCMMDILLNETNPEYFHFIPDVAWIHFAGRDPVDILKKMKGRVKVLHFKDYIINAEGERKFVSLGQGRVNLEDCYKAACELEIPYIMYEQDGDWVNDDPFEATEQSWEYMMNLQK